jgi:hypothetical protein
MKKNAWIASAVALACGMTLMSHPAVAQGPSVYGGGGVGYFRLNDDDFLDQNDRFKDNRTGWRLQAGAQLNPVLSLEGGHVDFGDLNDGSFRLSADGQFIAGLVHIPLSAGFAPYGKVGQLWWDTEARGPAPLGTVADADGNDFFYGLGIRFGEGPGLQARLEYDRMALDDADVDMASLILQYRF